MPPAETMAYQLLGPGGRQAAAPAVYGGWARSCGLRIVRAPDGGR
ncbi:hypothetical protein [Kitasatospora sp. McL0602]